MPKTITVKFDANGTPECVPIVTRVRPGGTLLWVGEKHSGAFDGTIPGPPRDDFTLDDLAALHPTACDMPFSPPAWEVLDATPGAQSSATINVDANAESGVMYKYSITANGKMLDPIIIVDNGASEN